MDDINKQKFLAELGRLLTFMYEEDRLEALAMYTRMFDDAKDEQAILQYLVSPTRQAVVLARSYDAKERKLQVHSQSRSGEAYADGETPDYVQAIDALQREAASLGVISPVEDENQISLFDDGPQETQAAPVYEEAAPQLMPEPVTEPQSELMPEPQSEPQSELMPEAAQETGDKVDVFLAGFSLAESELPPQPQAAPLSIADVPETAAELQPETAEAPVTQSAPQPVAEAPRTERRTNVALLILFIILAIPLSLIGIVLLLVPTVLFLAMAVSAVSLGIMAVSSAFAGGLSLLADVLALLGVALVLLALGLLFAWVFVWFIGGAIAGLIRGVFALGRKWCTKEVPVK